MTFIKTTRTPATAENKTRPRIRKNAWSCRNRIRIRGLLCFKQQWISFFGLL